MMATTILLSPVGLFSLSVPQKYRVDDILDLNDSTVKTFADLLHLPKAKRYQILYSLAINNLLLLPNNDDVLEWIQKRRSAIELVDDLISIDDLSFRSVVYDLTFTGKRSSMFRMLDSLTVHSRLTELSSTFANTFHIFPNKFVGGSERITDHDKFREKIRLSIESNFILSEVTLEQTFNLIDEIYFSQLLKYRLQAAGKKISFKISYQMTSCAGSLKSKEKEYIITIASKLNEVLGNKLNSGIKINGPVDAFIVTLQHEMTHLIVHLEMDRLGIKSDSENPDFKSHGPIFKDIGLRFFNLTESCHHLFEGENELPAISLAQLSIGSQVYFEPNCTKGKLVGVRRVYGRITKINPKTVAVESEDHGNWKVPHQTIHLV